MCGHVGSGSGSGSGSEEESEEEGEESEEDTSSDEGDTLQNLQKRFGVAPTKKKVCFLPERDVFCLSEPHTRE